MRDDVGAARAMVHPELVRQRDKIDPTLVLAPRGFTKGGHLVAHGQQLADGIQPQRIVDLRSGGVFF